jgi:hypothetical protein
VATISSIPDQWKTVDYFFENFISFLPAGYRGSKLYASGEPDAAIK